MGRAFVRRDLSTLPLLEIVLGAASFHPLIVRLPDDYPESGAVEYSSIDLGKLGELQELLQYIANDIADLLYTAGHADVDDLPF